MSSKQEEMWQFIMTVKDIRPKLNSEEQDRYWDQINKTGGKSNGLSICFNCFSMGWSNTRFSHHSKVHTMTELFGRRKKDKYQNLAANWIAIFKQYGMYDEKTKRLTLLAWHPKHCVPFTRNVDISCESKKPPKQKLSMFDCSLINKKIFEKYGFTTSDNEQSNLDESGMSNYLKLCEPISHKETEDTEDEEPEISLAKRDADHWKHQYQLAIHAAASPW